MVPELNDLRVPCILITQVQPVVHRTVLASCRTSWVFQHDRIIDRNHPIPPTVTGRCRNPRLLGWTLQIEGLAHLFTKSTACKEGLFLSPIIVDLERCTDRARSTCVLGMGGPDRNLIPKS